MSWPLFCHQAGPSSAGAAPDIIFPAGTSIDATTIWDSELFGTPTYSNASVLLGVSGTKIMANPAAENVFYTNDLGDNWTQVGDVPDYGSGYRCDGFAHDSVTDTWFIAVYVSPSIRTIYRSTNDGVTWTLMTGVLGQYSSTAMIMDSERRLVSASAGRASGRSYIQQWAAPYTGSPTDTLEPGASVNVYNLREVPGASGYYMMEVWDGAEFDLQYLDKATLTTTSVNSPGTEGSNWTEVATDTFAQAITMANNTDQTYNLYTPGDATTPVPHLDFTWDEQMELGRMQTDKANYVISMGQPSGGVTTRWVLRHHEGGDFTENDFSGDLTLNLDHTPDNSEFTWMWYATGKTMIANYRTGGYTKIIRFDIGTVADVGNASGPLFSAINTQAPDIFMRMDDDLAVTTVRDTGTKGYVNATSGDLTFEQTGLVSDGGTAVLVDSTAGAGILVDAVPAPTDHAHVFVFQHDATAVFRVLASSGDISNPTSGHSYYIALASDHKLTVATYDGSWTFETSTATIATSTTTLAAVQIKNGEVIFYIEDARDSVHTASIVDLSATILSLGGAWDGTTLDDSADGVIIDYYALIPNANFSYAAINEGYGGSYVKPTVTDVATTNNVAFLMHADESAMLGPFASERVIGRDYYTLLNSVTGSVNRISSEAKTGRLITTDKKFGAGAATITARIATTSSWNPWDMIYWPITDATPSQRGLPPLTLGTRDFTYDLWVKPVIEAPFYIANNAWIVHTGGSSRSLYGGFSAHVSPSATVATQCDITMTFYGQRSSPGPKMTMKFKNASGYTVNDWMHFAICRKDGVFYVFVNGNRATGAGISAANIAHYIPAGEAFMIGSGFYAGPSTYYRTQSSILVDEARLVLDEGLLTEDFTPPTTAYSYP